MQGEMSRNKIMEGDLILPLSVQGKISIEKKKKS